MPYVLKSLGSLVVRRTFETKQEAEDNMAELKAQPLYAGVEFIIEEGSFEPAVPRRKASRKTRSKSVGRGRTRSGGRSSGGGGSSVGPKRKRKRTTRRSGRRR
jgi:hypothetical protein